MTKRHIQWIIGLMTIALLGLAGFQFYWIRETLRAKQEQFDGAVSEALQAVVRKVEKQEIVYLTNRKLAADAQKQRLMAIGRAGGPTSGSAVADSKKTSTSPTSRPRRRSGNGIRQTPAGYTYRRPKPDNEQKTAPPAPWESYGKMTMPTDAYVQELTILPDGQVHILEEYYRHEQVVDGQIDELNRIRQAADRQYNDMVFKAFRRDTKASRQRRDSLGQALSARLQGKDPPTRRVAVAPKSSARKPALSRNPVAKPATKPDLAAVKSQFQQQSAEHQTELLKDVFYELVFKQRNVADRLDRFMLDSLLKDEVRGRGIAIPFEYGVQTAEHKNQLLFSSSPGYRDDRLLSEGYRANLFPNDLFSSGNFLYVFFPDQRGYIVRQLWVTFASALVLMLIVVACFYVAVRTIIEQKKVADIKNDFINNMTHEFKTPVSTISLAVQVLQDKEVAANSSMLNRYLGIIQDENRRLGQQVEKVLQAALLDRGEVKLKRTSIDVNEVIERVALNLSPQIEARQGTLDLELHAENPVLQADEVHLTNLIFNLLDNANKYSPAVPEITIRTADAEGGLRIQISDRGAGMAREQISRIFEKFYRVPTGNLHDVKGFGLGLSYVKTMVEAHQGRIEVESQPGAGSTFTIFLPRQFSKNAEL
ncbi:MAG: two-component sensor histidine kinase [Cytophagaceae bacterium]|nr:two-component sensor histidine kinase [Cytophagaceae bacterium]